MSLQFEWDPRKEAINWRKHAISFAEAVTVFADPQAKIFDDPDHSLSERREIVIGYSSESRLLLIIFTERSGRTLRIISARKATKSERHDYEENL